MRIAYPGLPGAFSHEACITFLPDHEATPREEFEQVVNSVAMGEVELGLLPLSNNAAGDTGAAELIASAGLCILEEYELSIRMHLLGVAGSRLNDIRTIVSHPVALRQCARQIAALGLSTEEVSNTAAAAAALRDPTRAVLASAAAGRIYGLEILKPDMQDRSDNATRFAIFSRDGGVPYERCLARKPQ